MSVSIREALGAHTLLKQGFAPQAVSNATKVTGSILDTANLSNPASMVALVNYVYTTSAGAAGAYQTILVTVEHGAQANLSDASTYKSFSYQQNWTNNGVNSGTVCLPVDLRNDPTVNSSNAPCKRYIRITVTITLSGTVTIAAQTASAQAVLGGLLVVPATAFSEAGYAIDVVTP